MRRPRSGKEEQVGEGKHEDIILTHKPVVHPTMDSGRNILTD